MNESRKHVTQLADLLRALGRDSPLGLRHGVITAISAGDPPTVSLQVGGSSVTVAGVRFMANYRPVVGERVLVDMNGPDPVVRGRLRSQSYNDDPAFLGLLRAGALDTAQFYFQASEVVFITNGSGDFTVSYDRAFPNATLMVVCSGGDSEPSLHFNTFGYTSSKFDVRVHFADGSVAANGAVRMNFVALGS